jgi:hypothetical protein
MAEGTVIRFDTDRRRGYRLASIRHQEPTHLAIVGQKMVFVTRQLRSDAWLTPKDGSKRRLTYGGMTKDVAACGPAGFLMAERGPAGISVVRVSLDGRREVLTSGHWDFAVECSKTSDDWWFSRSEPGGGLYHCRGRSCERIVSGDVHSTSLSPDGDRLAFFAFGKRGPSVKWIPSEGGAVRDVADSEGACPPGWSSSSTIWVSRRIHGRPIWTEVDADSGRPTGHTSPAANDCQGGYAGYPDPLSPVRPEIRIVFETTSQIRTKDLPGPPPASRPPTPSSE